MKTRARMLAAPLALALVIAACGSDDDSGGSTDTAAPATEAAEEATEEAATEEEATEEEAMEEEATEDAAGGEGLVAAQAVVDANLVPPTEIVPTIPLESVPEQKTVAWLECSLPSCIAIGVGMREAADALGWNLEVISWSTDAAAAFQQALDQGVDYVAITGTQPELIQDQLDQANAAGIPTMSCFDAAEPSPDGFAMQCGDTPGVIRAGDLISNAIIADSGGTANTVMLNISSFDVLVAEKEGAEAAYAANCPDCTFDVLDLTLDQLLAGEVPGALVSYLQSNPDVDYVHFAFDGLAGGVSATLADAGLLEGRNLVGVDFSGAILQEIVDGTQQFWTANPKEYSAWLMLDAMARHAIGQENTEERANALLPTFIVTTPEVAEPLIPTDGWPGPEGQGDQFKALWGV